MKKKQSEYIITLGDQAQLEDLFNGPALLGHSEPRFIMAGRSNVGKSSLINALLRTDLAQTSKQPGKTRKIHFYLWHTLQMIVADLPGYGYARASHTDRETWKALIGSYLKADSNLVGALLLIDIRVGWTPPDLEAYQFLSFFEIPVTIVHVKMDALKNQSEKALCTNEAKKSLATLRIHEVFWVSSRKGTGLEDLVRYLKNLRKEI